jgi:hypothetical protein
MTTSLRRVVCQGASGLLFHALCLTVGTSVTFAQVDCNDPDNLCTGDPCVISTVVVPVQCVVDFGPRTLIVAGNIVPVDTVSPANEVDFTAAAIEVGDGASIRATVIDLTATAGNVEVNGRLRRVHGINLTASGDILATRALRGSQIQLTAAGNINLQKRVSANPGTGCGGIAIEAGGDVDLPKGASCRSRGTGGLHIDVVVDAGGSTRVGGRVLAGGKTAGGTIDLRGDAEVVVDGTLRALGRFVGGSVVVASANGPATFTGSVDVGTMFSGGSVRIEGTAVQVQASLVSADHPSSGNGQGVGTIRFAATAGALDVVGVFSARGGMEQGIIEGTATGDVTVSGTFEATPNGCIAFAAGGTLDTTNATFDPPLVGDCPGS